MAGRGQAVDTGAAVATAEAVADSGPEGSISTGTESYIDGLDPGADGADFLDMIDGEMEDLKPGSDPKADGGPDGADPEVKPDGTEPDAGPDAEPERKAEEGPVVDLGDVPAAEKHEERSKWLSDSKDKIKDGIEKTQALLKEKKELEITEKLEQHKRLLEKAKEEGRKGAIKLHEKEITQTQRALNGIDKEFEKKLKTQLGRADGLIGRTERDETDRQRLDDAGLDSDKKTSAAERGIKNIGKLEKDLNSTYERTLRDVERLRALAAKPEAAEPDATE